jgi:phage-related minor tail protein
MATTKQKAAARENIKKVVAASASRSRSGARPSESRHPMSAAVKKELEDDEFAFPRQRKEPLTDARHVRNAIARFDQVEDVSDSERDAAWRRINTAAKKYDIEVTARGWRELFKGRRPGRPELLNPRSPLADTSEASPNRRKR